MRFFSDDSERFFPTFTRDSFLSYRNVYFESKVFRNLFFIQDLVRDTRTADRAKVVRDFLVLVRSGILVRGSLDLGKDGIFFISLESSAHLFSFFQSIR